jgi:hypothetical protein
MRILSVEDNFKGRGAAYFGRCLPASQIIFEVKKPGDGHFLFS